MRVLCNLLVTIAMIGALMSLGALLSRYHIIFDIGSHFRVQYIVLLLPAILLAVFFKRRLAVLLMIAVVLIHGHAIVRSLLPQNFAHDADGSSASTEQASAASDKHILDASTELHVLTTNVLLDNSRFDEYLTQVKELDADVIAVLEYTPAWHRVLSQSLTAYAHRITEPLNGGFGTALYSKYPIVSGGLLAIGVDTMPSIDVQIAVGDSYVRVIAVHPPPPMSQEYYESRNRTLQGIVQALRPENPIAVTGKNTTDDLVRGAEIVVGDFNSTPWSGHFSDMERDAGLTSARRGQGILPTWPDGVLPLLVPIDHMLVGSRVSVLSLHSFRVAGSDHRGLSGKFRIDLQQE